MERARRLTGLKGLLRPIGRPVKLLLHRGAYLRLRWVHFTHGVDGIQDELRRTSWDPAEVLRRYGADVAPDAHVVGPISIVNAGGDLSNLKIGAMTHVGSEVFLDLADRVTIGDRATISMRACIVTHFDAGHGPLAERMPRKTGPVTIGDGAYLGVGVIVLHGLEVGREAVVAAGALVREDVPDGEIVGGVPARPLRSKVAQPS